MASTKQLFCGFIVLFSAFYCANCGLLGRKQQQKPIPARQAQDGCTPEKCEPYCRSKGITVGREFKLAYCLPSGECSCQYGNTLQDCNEQQCAKTCNAALNETLELVSSFCNNKACQCKYKVLPEPLCNMVFCQDKCSRETPSGKRPKKWQCIDNQCTCEYEDFVCSEASCGEFCRGRSGGGNPNCIGNVCECLQQ